MLKPEDLPSYKHPDYKRMEAHLMLLEDCYMGLLDKKGVYLPKAHKEPEMAYKQRVEASTFNNKLRPTIDSNAGLLTAFEVQKLPPTLKDAEDDVDLQGSNFKSFFQEADTLALRDRYCFIMVDAPELDENTERTAADAIENPRRPHLKIIERKNILNWRKRYVGGRCIVDSITFQLEVQEPDGAFGVKAQVYYHQLSQQGGMVVHQKWMINEKGQSVPVDAPKATELSSIPIVCYPCTSSPFNTDTPAFYKLATLNIKLFRKESTLDEIEYRVNCPTVKRTWPGDVPDNPPPVTQGATWVIEVPQGGSVDILEMSGSGIAALQNSINELKADIEAESMAFLQGSTVQRTATESFLSSSQVQASLNGYMRDKESAIATIIDHWCEYTGEQNTVEFEVDHSVLEMPLDSGEMGQLLQLFNAGVISHYHLLSLLKMGRQLPPNVDVKEWVKEVQKERDREMQSQIPDNVADLSAYQPNRQPQQQVV